MFRGFVLIVDCSRVILYASENITDQLGPYLVSVHGSVWCVCMCGVHGSVWCVHVWCAWECVVCGVCAWVCPAPMSALS